MKGSLPEFQRALERFREGLRAGRPFNQRAYRQYELPRADGASSGASDDRCEA